MLKKPWCAGSEKDEADLRLHLRLLRLYAECSTLPPVSLPTCGGSDEEQERLRVAEVGGHVRAGAGGEIVA